MRDIAELNINDGGESVSRPAPSVDEIKSFEERFGILFPEGLLTLLRHSNGGCPELDSLDGDEGDYAVDHFFHLSSDRECWESYWKAMETYQPLLGDKALPFAADGGGDPFFLDLNETPAPVMLYRHDGEYDREKLADSFGEFIDRLDIRTDLD